MILGPITWAIAECLADLGYDAHPGIPAQFEPPAAIVEPPEVVTYHVSAGQREHIRLSVLVVVARVDAEDAIERMYAAMSTEETPGLDVLPLVSALESYAGPWRSLTVLSSSSVGAVPLSSTSQQSGLAARFVIEVSTLPRQGEDQS